MTVCTMRCVGPRQIVSNKIRIFVPNVPRDYKSQGERWTKTCIKSRVILNISGILPEFYHVRVIFQMQPQCDLTVVLVPSPSSAVSQK